MKVPASLASLELERAEGGLVRLGDGWRDAPVVLFWIRHFG